MFIINLWRFIKGYLIVKAEGRGTEKFINLAVTRGIHFWDLKKSHRGAVFKIPVKTFKKSRPLVRQSRCRVKIQRKRGLPFIAKKTRRRKGFVAGVCLFLIVIYVFTSFVWYIDISGLENIKEKEVLEIGKSMGIKPGTYKGSLDLGKLEKELARRHEDITWAGMSFRGTLLHIEIAEHIPEPAVDERPADLIAEKDGLILKLLAIEGKPMVEPGDIVSKGDILIKGIKDYDEELMAEEEDFEPQSVRARGEIEARVWYEARSPIIKKEVIKKPTGTQKTNTYLILDNKKISFWWSSDIPFALYNKDIVKRTWSWRNLSLPVELVTVTYHELKTEKYVLTEKEAFNRAKDLARKEVMALIPDGVKKERMFYEEQQYDDAREVRLVAETREDISRYRIIR